MDKIKYKIIAQYQNKTYQALHKLSTQGKLSASLTSVPHVGNPSMNPGMEKTILEILLDVTVKV